MIKTETMHRKLDKKHPYLPLCYGVLEQKFRVGIAERRMLSYIPDTFRPSGSGIFVLAEDGRTAEDVLNDSWLKKLADMDAVFDKFMMIVLEPLNGKWNTEEPYGTPDGDVAYVDAAFDLARKRLYYDIHESKFYLFGIREGGVIANMEAMFNPAVWSGITVVAGSNVSAPFMNDASEDYATNLCFLEDPEHRKNIKKGEIPMPAWIIDDPRIPQSISSAVTEYWKRSCGITSADKGKMTDAHTVSFVRNSLPEYSADRDRNAYEVRVSRLEGASENDANRHILKIRNFLNSHQRWMGNPGGDLRVSHDYVNEKGWEYHTEEIDGWQREWFAYVPEKVIADPDREVPLVFAMHGYSNTGEEYGGHSEWFKVADQYGFIVVHPSALPGKLAAENDFVSADNIEVPGWNYSGNCVNDGPDEKNFFSTMIARMSDWYKIDKSRIYITGHSHGSQMTHTLALTMTDVFAAAAPCSGVIFTSGIGDIYNLPGLKDRPDVEIPVWMFGGEEEKWLMDNIPGNDNDTGKTLAFYRKINHMAPYTPDSWKEGWSCGDNRWHDLIYKNESGSPMVGFSWVDYMPHATMTEMTFRIWREFFCKFRRVDGKVKYLP